MQAPTDTYGRAHFTQITLAMRTACTFINMEKLLLNSVLVIITIVLAVAVFALCESNSRIIDYYSSGRLAMCRPATIL